MYIYEKVKNGLSNSMDIELLCKPFWDILSEGLCSFRDGKRGMKNNKRRARCLN